MADTFNKKALQQKRAKKKQDKLERREERKAHNNKGKSLEEMTVYLDEFGNITDVPPEKVSAGDFVELFGANIPLDDVADAAGTIGYELLTSLGRRYRRHYVGAQPDRFDNG